MDVPTHTWTYIDRGESSAARGGRSERGAQREGGAARGGRRRGGRSERGAQPPVMPAKPCFLHKVGHRTKPATWQFLARCEGATFFDRAAGKKSSPEDRNGGSAAWGAQPQAAPRLLAVQSNLRDGQTSYKEVA